MVILVRQYGHHDFMISMVFMVIMVVLVTIMVNIFIKVTMASIGSQMRLHGVSSPAIWTLESHHKSHLLQNRSDSVTNITSARFWNVLRDFRSRDDVRNS